MLVIRRAREVALRRALIDGSRIWAKSESNRAKERIRGWNRRFPISAGSDQRERTSLIQFIVQFLSARIIKC